MQPLLDVARLYRQRVAAVERVPDLEERQQRRENDSQRISKSLREVDSARLEQAASHGEGRSGHAIAEQQPVEDRNAADVGAHDHRVPDDAPEHDEADRGDRRPQQRDVPQRRDIGGAERHQGERDRHVAARQEGDERETERGDGGRGKSSGREPDARKRQDVLPRQESLRDPHVPTRQQDAEQRERDRGVELRHPQIGEDQAPAAAARWRRAHRARRAAR